MSLDTVGTGRLDEATFRGVGVRLDVGSCVLLSIVAHLK